MKAEELMVGDLVQYRESKVLIKVTGVHEEDVYNKILNFPDDGWYTKICKLEPIPITPDILEKNGFEQRKFGSLKFNTYDYSDKEMKITFNLNKTGCWIKCKMTSINSNNIKYVHELQHALCLCGIKKEIIL